MNEQRTSMNSQGSCNSISEQINVLCRTCFKENDQRGTIDRLGIPSLLLHCFNIDIKSNTDLLESCIICSKCVSGLCQAYAFKTQIENSLKLFEKYLETQTNINLNNGSNEISLEQNIKTAENVKVASIENDDDIKKEMDVDNLSESLKNTSTDTSNNSQNANFQCERRKRNCYISLTLQQKLSAINDIEKGKKMKEVAEAYGIKTNTLSTIFKNRNNLKDQLSKNPAQLNKKRMRTGEFSKIDDAIVCFISEARKNHLPVSGRMIQEKAKQYGAEFNISTFKASNGWFHRLKKRTGI